MSMMSDIRYIYHKKNNNTSLTVYLQKIDSVPLYLTSDLKLRMIMQERKIYHRLT